MLKFFEEKTFKEHSQLAPMRIRYNFIANLHITETRSILLLTKYDKNNVTGWVKAHPKTDFSVYEWKSSKTFQRLERNSRFASFQVEVNSFQIEKTSVQVSAVSKLSRTPARTCKIFLLRAGSLPASAKSEVKREQNRETPSTQALSAMSLAKEREPRI